MECKWPDRQSYVIKMLLFHIKLIFFNASCNAIWQSFRGNKRTSNRWENALIIEMWLNVKFSIQNVQKYLQSLSISKCKLITNESKTIKLTAIWFDGNLCCECHWTRKCVALHSPLDSFTLKWKLTHFIIAERIDGHAPHQRARK